MLVAQLLVNASGGKIRWTLLTEPDDALDYQLPVLVGTCPERHSEPIRASIMSAKTTVRGDVRLQQIRGKVPEYLLKEIKGPREVIRKAATADI